MGNSQVIVALCPIFKCSNSNGTQYYVKRCLFLKGLVILRNGSHGPRMPGTCTGTLPPELPQCILAHKWLFQCHSVARLHVPSGGSDGTLAWTCSPVFFYSREPYSLSCFPVAIPRCDAVACGPKGVYQGTVFPSLWWKMQGATVCFSLGKEHDGTLLILDPPRLQLCVQSLNFGKVYPPFSGMGI